MKVIVSHDVDHISAKEHLGDLMIPKLTARSLFELMRGRVSITECVERVRMQINNKWQNIEELALFDAEKGIPSTFFFGVSHGLGLRYSVKDAEFWIQRLTDKGFEVGIHGIAFDNFNQMKDEFEKFKVLSGRERFGIRMHYLRKCNRTVNLLNEVGYAYDSSVTEARHPFRVGDLWEFPVHIMDGWVMCDGARWQTRSFHDAKESTMRVIDNASDAGVEYFSVLFHDFYFSDAFRTWKAWYVWLVEYLMNNGIAFVGYQGATEELNESARC